MAPTVLVTGASGFLAAHVVETFLRQGYNVRGTVRSEKTAANVRKTHADFAEQLSLAIVPDIAAPGAFNEAVKDVDGVIHTASPFTLNAKDVQKELYEPAIQGTTSILEAVHNFNPKITRVVITSSFASALDLTKGARPGYTYSEADWNPVLGDDAAVDPTLAYMASKSMAERAAFKFVEDNKPNFNVTTILPPLVYGPVIHHVPNRKSLGTSAWHILRMFDGTSKEVPQTAFYAFVDVRDVAQAHIRAYETPEAAGQRYITSSAAYCYQNVVDIIRERFPELKETTPEGEKGAPIPPSWRIDTTKVQRDLGMTFKSLEESVVDTVNSLLSIPE